MKTLTTLFLAIVMLASANAGPVESVSTSTLNPSHDSVLTARAFALHTPDRYNFNCYVQTNENGVLVDHSMYGVRTPEGLITRLTVDDVLVLDEEDPPLRSLPLPKNGVIIYVSVNLDAWEQGRFVSWGYFYASNFKRGGAMNVIMNPASAKVFVKYKLPTGVDPRYIWINIENYGGGMDYDVFAGGFYVYLDPSVHSNNYSVIDQRTGAVLLTGVVGPYDGSITASATASAISLTYADNVLDATPGKITGGYTQYLGQKLDGQTIDPTTGVKTPAKVFFVRLEGKELWASLGNITGTVEVFEVTEQGDLPLLFKGHTIVNQFDGVTSYIEVKLPAGYGAVIIKVTGTPKPEGFSIGVANGPVG